MILSNLWDQIIQEKVNHKKIFMNCVKEKSKHIVIEDVDIVKCDNSLEELLQLISTVEDHGTYKNYSGLGYQIYSSELNEYKTDKYYGSARSLFVAYLNTLNRITISNPAELIHRKSTKRHPIHYVAFDRKYREWLRTNDQYIWQICHKK